MLSRPMTSVDAETRAINAFNDLKGKYNSKVCFFRKHGEYEYWSMMVLDKFSLFVADSEVYTLLTARDLSEERDSFPFRANSLDEVLSLAASRFPAISP